MSDQCDGNCKCNDESHLTFFGKSFWDLWFQKIFRNFASVKYQWLLYMAVPTFLAMFTGRWYYPTDGGAPQFIPMLSHTIGYSFLGGGFITLATSRIIARTKLVEPKGEDELDTDK